MDIFLILISLGLTAGFLSSLFGVGGGIVIVPALFFLFPELPAQTVIGSSLLFITLGSLINLYNFWRSGMHPNLKLLTPILVLAIVGAACGGWCASYLNKSTIQLIFTIIILVIAIRILTQARHSSQTQRAKNNESLARRIYWIIRRINLWPYGIGRRNSYDASSYQLVQYSLAQSFSILKLYHASFCRYGGCNFLAYDPPHYRPSHFEYPTNRATQYRCLFNPYSRMFYFFTIWNLGFTKNSSITPSISFCYSSYCHCY